MMEKDNITVGQRIKARRIELGLSVEDIAKKLNKNRATIYRYESDYIENLPISILEPLAHALHITPAALMGWIDNSEAQRHGVHMPSQDFSSSGHVSPGAVRVNVYGTIPAGVPMEAIENIVDIEEIPEEWTRGGKEYFGLVVKGDSMYPIIADKDVIIVCKQPTCDSGDICVVYVNGFDATLKRVLLNDDGSITLKPENPNYAPRTFTREEAAAEPVLIGGVVIEIRRKLK